MDKKLSIYLDNKDIHGGKKLKSKQKSESNSRTSKKIKKFVKNDKTVNTVKTIKHGSNGLLTRTSLNVLTKSQLVNKLLSLVRINNSTSKKKELLLLTKKQLIMDILRISKNVQNMIGGNKFTDQLMKLEKKKLIDLAEEINRPLEMRLDANILNIPKKKFYDRLDSFKNQSPADFDFKIEWDKTWLPDSMVISFKEILHNNIQLVIDIKNALVATIYNIAENPFIYITNTTAFSNCNFASSLLKELVNSIEIFHRKFFPDKQFSSDIKFDECVDRLALGRIFNEFSNILVIFVKDIDSYNNAVNSFASEIFNNAVDKNITKEVYTKIIENRLNFLNLFNSYLAQLNITANKIKNLYIKQKNITYM